MRPELSSVTTTMTCQSNSVLVTIPIPRMTISDELLELYRVAATTVLRGLICNNMAEELEQTLRWWQRVRTTYHSRDRLKTRLDVEEAFSFFTYAFEEYGLRLQSWNCDSTMVTLIHLDPIEAMIIVRISDG